MANVLYLSNDGLTDPLGRSQIIPYMKGLSADHNIHILACEKAENYNENRDKINELLSESRIKWHVINYRNKPPVLSSWLMQRELGSAAKNIIREHNIDFIHCRSYPAAITGMKLSACCKIPFLFDMRGFWADERVERRIWNKKNPVYALLYNYFKRKEKNLLAASMHIITLTEKAKEILIEKFNVDAEKVTVIPCAADLAFFKKQGEDVRAEYRRKLGLNDDEKLLMYIGSTGSCYLTKEMLEFYMFGKKRIPELRMAFFSPKGGHETIIKTAKSVGINDQELILKFIPREELPFYLSAVDYSIMLFEPSFSIQGSSPTKHGELLGMNIPVVANNNVGDLEAIIKEKNTGFVINDFSDEQYEKAYGYLTATKFSKEDFSYVAKKHYSLEAAVEKLQRIYNKL